MSIHRATDVAVVPRYVSSVLCTDVVYTVSTMQLCGVGAGGGGSRVRCVWLGVRREDARHATLASSLASTADNSLVMVRVE